jgi:hypothetical protein
VQHLREGLGRGAEVKAFPGCVVVGRDKVAETAVGDCGKVGFAGHEAPHPADGILDTAFLPGRVRVAEEGIDRQLMQSMMAGELGAVVESNGLAEALRHGAKQLDEMTGDAIGGLAGQPDCQQQAGLALMQGQDGLAVFCKHHQIGFPMAAGVAIAGLDRPFRQRNTAFNEACRASALPAPAAALALAARQISAPAIVLGASDLGVDEAVDAFVGDHLAPLLKGEATGDLLGRPTACEPLNNGGSQALVAFQARTLPAPGAGLLVGIAGSVTGLSAPITVQLPRDR